MQPTAAALGILTVLSINTSCDEQSKRLLARL